MSKELCRPRLEIVEAVLQKALVPQLQQIEEEIRGVLVPRVVLFVSEHDFGPSILIQSGRNEEIVEPNGEVRLCFRSTYQENRLRFFAEGVFDKGVSSIPSFSGFMMDGEVRIGDTVDVRTKSHTLRRNVWRWTGWM